MDVSCALSPRSYPYPYQEGLGCGVPLAQPYISTSRVAKLMPTLTCTCGYTIRWHCSWDDTRPTLHTDDLSNSMTICPLQHAEHCSRDSTTRAAMALCTLEYQDAASTCGTVARLLPQNAI
jgi:hypothetical protein